MIKLKRTDSSDPDFASLVKLLDADLAERDGPEHAFYNKFNAITHIKNAVVAFEDGKPLGCGAIREFDERSMEVKRMYVLPESRGKKIATKVLVELEKWAAELSYSR